MTKSKSSTIAIVVLSVLLAAALASTIVLAAFSQSKTATTTITFANGVVLTLAGDVADGDAQGKDYILGTGTKTGLTSADNSIIDEVTAYLSETSPNATIGFEILPTVTGASLTSLAKNDEDHTATWTLTNSTTSNTVTLVITVPATVTIDVNTETKTATFTTGQIGKGQSNATPIITSIGTAGNDNDFAGISVTMNTTFTATSV